MQCSVICIQEQNKGEHMKHYATWIKQLRDVNEDIKRLESGKFSWYTPNFYYGTDNEKQVLAMALKLKAQLEHDLNKAK
jgi:hypothetical protein